MARTLVLIVLLAASASAAAQIYRWTDEQGRVHYGSQPPPGQKADSVKQPQSGGTTSQDVQSRQREAADRAERDRQELERYNQCQEFERKLRQAQSGGDPGYYGRPMSDEERQAMIRSMLAMREHVCR
jgi:hypothetical protein